MSSSKQLVKLVQGCTKNVRADFALASVLWRVGSESLDGKAISLAINAPEAHSWDSALSRGHLQKKSESMWANVVAIRGVVATESRFMRKGGMQTNQNSPPAGPSSRPPATNHDEFEGGQEDR